MARNNKKKVKSAPARDMRRNLGLPSNGNSAGANALANQLVRSLNFTSMMPRQARKGKAKRRAQGGVKEAALMLSMPAAKFAAAILNPWAPEALGSYIPIGNGRPSQKVIMFQRFDITVGTGGVGWVAVAPGLAANASNVWYTGSTYAGTTIVPYAVPLTAALNTGVFALSPSNAPFSVNNLSLPYTSEGVGAALSVYGRVVACGLTASYTGTTLNEGGLLYCFVDPDHNSVIGASVATLGSRMETEVANVSRQKCYLSDFPLQEAEADFDRTTEYAAIYGATFGTTPETGRLAAIVPVFPFSSGQQPGPGSDGLATFLANFTGGAPTMCVMATGTPGNTIHVEVVTHVEYQGPGCEGRTTPSFIDRVGFGHVVSAASGAVTRRSTRHGMDFSDAFLETLSELKSELRPASSAYLKKAIGN